VANTLIQIKSSTANVAPVTLNIAEPAYSYVSNTLFIGTANSDGVIAIGGKFYLDQQAQIYEKTNLAFAAANSAAASSVDSVARDTANSAGSYANSAFSKANNSTDLWVRDQANNAYNTANAAYIQANTPSYVANSAALYANTAYLQANTPSYVANSAALYANGAFALANTKFNSSGGLISGNVTLTGNIIPTAANTYFLGSEASPFHSVYVGPGSINIDGVVLSNTNGSLSVTSQTGATLNFTSVSLQANAAYDKANSANVLAQQAFDRANTKFNSSGGTISGDTNITGNLTVTGTAIYTNTVYQLIGDNIITLNADISPSTQPTENAGLEINRGAQPNAQFIWVESAGKWAANNGNSQFYIGSESGETYANAAFLQANTPSYTANSSASYANAAFIQANAAFASVNTITVIGNTINLGSNTVGLLVSNAVTLTTTTKVTDGLALINNVLGKLVPPGPPAFPSGNNITIASTSSYRMANFTQTDRTSSSRGVAAGTTVTNAKRVATYGLSAVVPDQGPGDSGTLTLFVNGANSVAYTFTSSSANGTYTSGNHSLVISDSVDYGSKVVGTAQGFWRSFDCTASGTVSNGWNELYISHSGASSTNTPFWYYDDSAPGAVVVSNGSLTVNSAAYSNSSTIPHYTSATLFNTGFNIAKLSGDMYPTSDTFVSSAAGGAFGANSGVTYAQAGITTPLARNLYVSSGQATVNLTSAVIAGFGSSATGVTVTGQNSYTAGSLVISPSGTILYKTGNTSSNTVIAGEDNIFFGSTVGTGSTAAYRIVNPGSTDTPAYANGASAFDSTNGTLQTYDATLVAGTLKHDQTNYATGYLPVGPNLSSGRTGPQYFTFKFVRTSLSKFDIQFTGNTAGVWVAAPGTVIDSTSSLNGWLSMTTAYSGSGIPGVNSPGNGSNGCALGGTITANTSVSSHRKTCTFGTVSTSNSTNNEVYVRFKLLAGQTITALSLQTANN
jgi:hypothetical protein